MNGFIKGISISFLSFSLHLALTSKILLPLFFFSLSYYPLFLSFRTLVIKHHVNLTWHAMIIDVRRLVSYIFLSLAFLGFLDLTACPESIESFTHVASIYANLLEQNKAFTYMRN